jgi:hypothetical protein
MTNISSRPIAWITAFTVLSWLGEYVHNRYELPQLTLLSPENSIPALISALLFLAWWQMPSRRVTGIALLAWAFVHLIGGAIVSVIPFSFLPFYPEQSLSHYLTHILYGLAQVPLIIAMIWQVKKGSQSKSMSGAKA